MYHFIGIKGSGMSALACILKELGNDVQGSDIEKYVFTQEAVLKAGIEILPFNKDNIKEDMIVIVGNHFPDTHEEIVEAKKKCKNVYLYHEFLGEFMKQYTSFSICGTHGKTTTTGMLSHVLSELMPTGYLIGDSTGEMTKDAKNFVLESCEYKRHFLAYHPDYAILTNIDLDHVDYYKDIEDYKSAFEVFASQVKKCIVMFGDDENVRDLKVSTNHLYYGLNDGNDIQAKNITETKEGMKFDVYYKNELFGTFDLNLIGHHLLWDALGVIAICIVIGISYEDIARELATFSGTKRRVEVSCLGENIFVDDYAHHPTAIRVTLEAARLRYPDKKIVAIYKPDRYSRLVILIEDFIKALAIADEICIVPFNENTLKEEGYDIDEHYIADRIPNSLIVRDDDESASKLYAMGPAVYVGMSTKDVYNVLNAIKKYQSKKENL